MRFEQFDQDYEAAEQLLPDGDHPCEIVKVKEWFAKDQSRTALIVTLQPLEGDYSPIEKWLDPSQKRDHRSAMQLLDALGIPRDQDLGENAVGLRVIVTTKRGTKKTTGEPVTYVNGFAAAASPGAAVSPELAAKVAARTPKQKVEAAGQGGTNDDIPF